MPALTLSGSGSTIPLVDANVQQKKLAQEKINISIGNLVTVSADKNAALQENSSTRPPVHASLCVSSSNVLMDINGINQNAAVFQYAAISLHHVLHTKFGILSTANVSAEKYKIVYLQLKCGMKQLAHVSAEITIPNVDLLRFGKVILANVFVLMLLNVLQFKNGTLLLVNATVQTDMLVLLINNGMKTHALVSARTLKPALLYKSGTHLLVYANVPVVLLVDPITSGMLQLVNATVLRGIHALVVKFGAKSAVLASVLHKISVIILRFGIL